MNMGFPDVCLTPAGPAVVPIPYPNMAMNAMAVPFLPTILLTCMPALNMGSMIPMTMGDDAGVANPMFKQMGRYTMGNPTILLQGLPAVHLGCPTSGNNMNNPVGAVLVPSVTNVLFTLAPGGDEREKRPEPADQAMGAEEVSALGQRVEALSEAPIARVAMLDDRTGYIALRFFAARTAAGVHHAIRELSALGMERLILDLCDNPGGEASAFIDLAGDFVEPGAVIATLTDVDGDDVVYHAPPGEPHRLPLVILVNGGTASAAELFAGCLQAHGRAVIVGERTYGKGCAQAAVPALAGETVQGVVAQFTLSNGRSIQGKGVVPDLAAGKGALEEAWRRAKGAL
jgi:carboxyl-terminal processing protease